MALTLFLLAFLLPPRFHQPTAPTDLEVETVSGEVRSLSLADLPITDPRELGLVLVRPRGFPRREPASADRQLARVELAGGDHLLGRVAGGRGESLVLELVAGVRLELDVSELAGLVFLERTPAGTGSPLEAPPEGDRLYRVSGASLDRVDGTLLEFLFEGVRFDSEELGARVFPWEELAAIFVEVLEEPGGGGEEAGVAVVVDLHDRSRIRGRLVELAREGPRMRVAGEAETTIAWKEVAEVAVDDGSFLFLSTWEGIEEEGHGAPFGDELGMLWPHRIDRSVTGGPLVTGGERTLRGIGVHAPSRLRFRLGGEWSELRGSVGIDDSALFNAESARGSVVFRIVADGKTLWESGVLRGGDPTRAFGIQGLQGVEELVLEADPSGEFGGDRANWLRPILVR